MIKHIKLAIAISIIGTLCACGSIMNPAGHDTFSCPGLPQGVICKTPAAVYKSSNGDLAQTDYDTPYGTYADKTDEISVKPTQGSQATFAVTGTPTVPRPIREPALIMRIWIAPWIDKNDNWNSGSYQYAEITKRRWGFGKSEAAIGGTIVPWRDIAASNNSQTVSAPLKPATNTHAQVGSDSIPNIPNAVGGGYDLNAGLPAVSPANPNGTR